MARDPRSTIRGGEKRGHVVARARPLCLDAAGVHGRRRSGPVLATPDSASKAAHHFPSRAGLRSIDSTNEGGYDHV